MEDRKLWKFCKFPQIILFWQFELLQCSNHEAFLKHSDTNMQISELMMSSPHNFALILFIEMTQIPYLNYGKVKLALYPPCINPNPIGLFWGLESIGGGGGGGGCFGPPPQISATNGPIDSKISAVVKQVK